MQKCDTEYVFYFYASEKKKKSPDGNDKQSFIKENGIKTFKRNVKTYRNSWIYRRNVCWVFDCTFT